MFTGDIDTRQIGQAEGAHMTQEATADFTIPIPALMNLRYINERGFYNL